MSDTISIQQTGTIVAYDAETGRVLHINEIFEEFDGSEARSGRAPDKHDCDKVFEMAERDNPECSVETIALACEDAPKLTGPKVWRVDLATKAIVVEAFPEAIEEQ